jgi:protein SCO1/2
MTGDAGDNGGAMKHDSLQLLAGVVAALALILGLSLAAAFAPAWLAGNSTPEPTPTPGGMAVDPPKPMRDFTLTGQDGQPMKLGDLRGRAVLLFFGYTHCPDVCPLSMADLRAAKKALGERAGEAAFVMISVDGARDTPEVMKRYVGSFDPDFIGLTGDETVVHGIAADYGAQFERQKPEGTAATYLVAHTSYIYLLDRQGRWRVTYPFQTPTGLIARDTERILDER